MATGLSKPRVGRLALPLRLVQKAEAQLETQESIRSDLASEETCRKRMLDQSWRREFLETLKSLQEQRDYCAELRSSFQMTLQDDDEDQRRLVNETITRLKQDIRTLLQAFQTISNARERVLQVEEILVMHTATKPGQGTAFQAVMELFELRQCMMYEFLHDVIEHNAKILKEIINTECGKVLSTIKPDDGPEEIVPSVNAADMSSSLRLNKNQNGVMPTSACKVLFSKGYESYYSTTDSQSTNLPIHVHLTASYMQVLKTVKRMRFLSSSFELDHEVKKPVDTKAGTGKEVVEGRRASIRRNSILMADPTSSIAGDDHEQSALFLQLRKDVKYLQSHLKEKQALTQMLEKEVSKNGSIDVFRGEVQEEDSFAKLRRTYNEITKQLRKIGQELLGLRKAESTFAVNNARKDELMLSLEALKIDLHNQLQKKKEFLETRLHHLAHMMDLNGRMLESVLATVTIMSQRYHNTTAILAKLKQQLGRLTPEVEQLRENKRIEFGIVNSISDVITNKDNIVMRAMAARKLALESTVQIDKELLDANQELAAAREELERKSKTVKETRTSLITDQNILLAAREELQEIDEKLKQVHIDQSKMDALRMQIEAGKARWGNQYLTIKDHSEFNKLELLRQKVETAVSVNEDWTRDVRRSRHNKMVLTNLALALRRKNGDKVKHVLEDILGSELMQTARPLKQDETDLEILDAPMWNDTLSMAIEAGLLERLSRKGWLKTAFNG
eukprot:GILJ01007630.1.p1 GENE.GILJ01007630.1~~GILJ01007630.1.p1  ORF type:complete len:734 (-),score=149.12 GILJ01007630.1:203-2404(-)